MINSYGEVIGINAFTLESGQNLNFAVDINQIYMVDTSVPVTVKEYYDKYIEDNFIEYNEVAEDINLSGDPDTCQLIETNTSVNGNVIPGTMDFYKVILPEDTLMTIVGYSASDHESYNLIIGVLDSNLEVLYASEEYYGAQYLYQVISMDYTAGTYYIVVIVGDYFYSPLDYGFYVVY